MQETRIQLLQEMAIFGGVREDILDFLLSVSPLVSVSNGEFFFHEGDSANSMFVLESGKVAVLKQWEGRQCLLCHLGQGDCFGEMALMDMLPRSASVVAIEDCKAIQLSTGGLYKVFERDPEQFALIQMNMGREVSRRLREAEERLFRASMATSVVGTGYVFQST